MVQKLHLQGWLLPLFLLGILTLTACKETSTGPTGTDRAQVELDIVASLPVEPISYRTEVQPILARRCVVCHGCYDAPCQLKLSSHEGLERGANPKKVYNGARILTMKPTRLSIDAQTTEEWRDKGFHSILNEGDDNSLANLQNSVLYRMLRLKTSHPQATTGLLSNDFDLSLDRKQTCPTIKKFKKYEKKFPNQGMPFAMPNLADDEFLTLAQWIAQGAPASPVKPIPLQSERQIKNWEVFLNGSSTKQQLVSRYLYEHLFQGHLHFANSNDREFYRLVRSTTPPGETLGEIATVRPYGDPKGPVYYRLVPYRADIVAKDHVVYELSPQRMERFKELFIEPEYSVAALPSWDKLDASNPFKTYEDIPPRSRYKFLLDDAYFFIEGFIKGPVCRGQVALNVIEDQFWVMFIDPDIEGMIDRPGFLREMADNLQLPSGQEGNIRLLSVWRDYQKRQQAYQQGRFEAFREIFGTDSEIDLKDAMKLVWDGDGNNPNAALTIFRHLDSASVDFGFIGDYPETAWVIDYPQLERIHYLLVAGFNVYGNLKHQLNTRLYMDFLRMEGEDNFLTLIPSSHRKQIRDSWYEGMRTGMDRDTDVTWFSRDIVTGYGTDDPQKELYQHLEQHLAAILNNEDRINRCEATSCSTSTTDSADRQADEAMRGIALLEGQVLAAFPDLTFVRVRMNKSQPEKDLAYTIIHNKAYKNVTSMFQSEEKAQFRDFRNDRLTVVDWLEGSYPNFFLVVDYQHLGDFINRYTAMSSIEDYQRLVSDYGVRRTNVDFWETADWFYEQSLREQPIRAGLFDLNRYHNR